MDSVEKIKRIIAALPKDNEKYCLVLLPRDYYNVSSYFEDKCEIDLGDKLIDPIYAIDGINIYCDTCFPMSFKCTESKYIEFKSGLRKKMEIDFEGYLQPKFGITALQPYLD